MCFDYGCWVSFQRGDESRCSVLGRLDRVCCITYLCVLGRIIPISKCWYHLLRDEFEKIKTVLPQFEDTNTLKPIFEALNGEIDYGIIRMTLTYLEMGKKVIY